MWMPKICPAHEAAACQCPGAGSGPLDSGPRGAETAVDEDERGPARRTDAEHVGDSTDGGDVSLQPDPAVRVGDGTRHVRVDSAKVADGHLNIAWLKPRVTGI